MANVAVVFYSSLVAESQRGPGLWPAYVREIGAQSVFSESPYTWSIMTVDDYSIYVDDHYPDYQSWLTSQSPDMERLIVDAMISAAEFGKLMNRRYAARNVMYGITTNDVLVLTDILAKLLNLLDSGSLETAYEEIEHNIPTNVNRFWDANVRTHFMAVIAAYLQGTAYEQPCPVPPEA